ncbi:MAG: hypothetical protein M3313_10320 [Actinomycetota bacterium]|nr:hypothetical protein [Actinomycetota bacterium]
MGRNDTHGLIAEIYGNSGADVDQLTQLRDRLDQVQSEVDEQDGPGGIVVATSKAFEVTRILVEEGILKTRHRGQGPVDHSRLRSIVAANLDYLQATLGALPGESSSE